MRDAEADLSMFSMFGRTGTPPGPYKRTGKFLLRRDTDNTVTVCVVWIQSGGEINKIDSDEQKSRQFCDERKYGVTLQNRTMMMTKKCRLLGGKKIGVLGKGPTFGPGEKWCCLYLSSRLSIHSASLLRPTLPFNTRWQWIRCSTVNNIGLQTRYCIAESLLALPIGNGDRISSECDVCDIPSYSTKLSSLALP